MTEKLVELKEVGLSPWNKKVYHNELGLNGGNREGKCLRIVVRVSRGMRGIESWFAKW